jgi:hypothetical protein
VRILHLKELDRHIRSLSTPTEASRTTESKPPQVRENVIDDPRTQQRGEREMRILLKDILFQIQAREGEVQEAVDTLLDNQAETMDIDPEPETDRLGTVLSNPGSVLQTMTSLPPASPAETLSHRYTLKYLILVFYRKIT